MFSAVLLVAITLFVPQVRAATALTTGNCPQDFNLLAANVTAGSKSTVDLIYGSIYSSSDQAVLEQSFSQGDTATIGSYVTNTGLLTPFIVIAVAFAITYIIAICCCIFEKSCPPCQAWKRDFSTNPYVKREIKCTTLFTLLFAVIIFIVAVIGLIFYPSLEEELTVIKCGMFSALDITINGDINNNWGGFSQVLSQSSNVSVLLADASASLTATFGGTNTLNKNLAAFRQQNSYIFLNNNFSTVQSPSHTPLPPFTPLFITNGLGPSSNSNTMTGDIENGIKVTEKVTIQGTKVYSAARLLSNSITNIQAKFTASMQAMNSNTNSLNAAMESVTKFSDNIIDGIFVELLYLIQGILTLIIISSILILLGAIATNYFEIYGCKACVHLGWIFYGLMYFGIIALCFIFFSIGGISYSFCKFYGGIVQNQAQLNNFSFGKNPTAFSKIFQTLTPCFFGSGSIAATFSLTNQTNTVNQLFSEMNIYINMQDSSKATYVDLNVSVSKINGWIDAIEKYRTGIYIDTDTTDPSENNPYVAIQNMNKYTNDGAGSPYPTCTYDYWVYDRTNCSRNTTQAIYTSSVTSGTRFVSTGFMCISFNEKFSSSSLNIWSQSDIMKRYVDKRSCQNDTRSFDKLMKYAASIIAYRDSRINLYQSLKDQLASLLTTNLALNNQIVGFTNNIIIFSASTSSLNSLMTSSINGMNVTSNCTVVANSLRLIYNVFCLNFVYKSVQLGICCLILLGIMVGGMLTGSVFAIRYNRIDKDPKVFQKNPPIHMQDQLSSSQQQREEEKEESSDTSSSSSDE